MFLGPKQLSLVSASSYEFQNLLLGQTPRHGKIELAIEVDTWFKPIGNWVKLLDINAPNKVWVYVCREKDKAESNLQIALREFRKLTKLRCEDKTNNVTIFMKVSGKTDGIKKHYLFE